VNNINYLREMDSVRIVQSGITYEGVITKVVNNDFPFIEGKFYEIDDIGQRVDDLRFNATVYARDFEGLKMEWWYEGQGGDNSAIGCSGSWETLVA
jgi:hypothetical protein